MAGQKGFSTAFTLFAYFFVLVNLFVVFPATVWAVNSPKVKDIFQSSSFKVTGDLDFNAKLQLAGKYIAYITLLYFILTQFVMSARGATSSPSPVVQKDSSAVETFNRCLINTLEESAIFIPNYFYWVIANSTKNDSHLIALFPLLWIFGRIVFTIGYVSGIMLGLSNLRGMGKVISLGISVMLVLRNIEWHGFENMLW
eukprot:CAMPEP_0176449530 /NCGR_PEP_ID=MMETSP0127-20121128/26526_1 /TAXON_ID=938130 /ORGANISM="Platyophrya macrostoma, Strain WH" /LENGTH=198 /DNA_ID=CAMNT_0017836873 /DNA_START=21 /DNA_END=614 /DNA_ORIENTATION=+